jgi:hypothetical protein
VSRGTLDPRLASSGFVYRPFTFFGAAFQLLPLPKSTIPQVLNPQHSIPSSCLLLVASLRSAPLRCFTELSAGFGLFPFRSPLLRKSFLLSLPPGTKMFQFPGFPPHGLCVQPWVTHPSMRRVAPFGYLRVIRLFAANRSFSQLATSFLGSWCLGIRPVLFVA